jgi:hypothetical protein
MDADLDAKASDLARQVVSASQLVHLYMDDVLWIHRSTSDGDGTDMLGTCLFW